MVSEPAKILAYYAVERGFASWPADPLPEWPASYAKLPAQEGAEAGHEWVAFFEGPSLRDSRQMRSQKILEFYGWQMIVRGVTDDRAKARGKLILDAFESLSNYAIQVEGTGFVIDNVSRQTRLLFLKEDEQSNLRLYTVSGYATIGEI